MTVTSEKAAASMPIAALTAWRVSAANSSSTSDMQELWIVKFDKITNDEH